MKKKLKVVGWIVFILLFIGNCYFTMIAYTNTRANAVAGIYTARAGKIMAAGGEMNRDMILTNKAIIKELLKKITPHEMALEG